MGKFHKILLCKRGVFGCPWINNNARRIKTSNYLHYSGIYKVSGFLGAKIAHNASANVCIIKKKGEIIKMSNITFVLKYIQYDNFLL